MPGGGGMLMFRIDRRISLRGRGLKEEGNKGFGSARERVVERVLLFAFHHTLRVRPTYPTTTLRNSDSGKSVAENPAFWIIKEWKSNRNCDGKVSVCIRRYLKCWITLTGMSIVDDILCLCVCIWSDRLQEKTQLYMPSASQFFLVWKQGFLKWGVCSQASLFDLCIFPLSWGLPPDPTPPIELVCLHTVAFLSAVRCKQRYQSQLLWVLLTTIRKIC